MGSSTAGAVATGIGRVIVGMALLFGKKGRVRLSVWGETMLDLRTKKTS
jgi:hypothetical protein